MKLRAEARTEDLDRYLNQASTAFGEAADATVRETTEGIKQAGRANISGGLSPRAGNLFASRYYLDPQAVPGAPPRIALSGYVYSLWWRQSASGQPTDILYQFETGATVTPKKAGGLARPLPFAGKLGLGSEGQRLRINPETFRRRLGLAKEDLRLLKLGGRSFLVVDEARLNRRGVASKSKGGARTKLGKYRQGSATLFVFELLRSMRIPKKISLGPLTERAQAQLPAKFQAELAQRLP